MKSEGSRLVHFVSFRISTFEYSNVWIWKWKFNRFDNIKSHKLHYNVCSTFWLRDSHWDCYRKCNPFRSAQCWKLGCVGQGIRWDVENPLWYWLSRDDRTFSICASWTLHASPVCRCETRIWRKLFERNKDSDLLMSIEIRWESLTVESDEVVVVESSIRSVDSHVELRGFLLNDVFCESFDKIE